MGVDFLSIHASFTDFHQRQQGQSGDVPCIWSLSVRSMQTHRPRRPPPRTHSEHQPDEVSPYRTAYNQLTLTIDAFSTSVIGIIAIPGMMTGAILGGSSVEQAARLQMVIMFMISSCTALSSIVTTILALGVVVDAEHRVRTDRIDTREHAVYRARNWVISKIVEGIKSAALCFAGRVKRLFKRRDAEESGSNTSERQSLLG